MTSPFDDKITAILEKAGGEILDALDEVATNDIMSRAKIRLSPYLDDGNTLGETYLIHASLDIGDDYVDGASFKLVDIIKDELELLDEDSRCRAGYDRALVGFVAELEECLAHAKRVLEVERAIGTRNGDWLVES